MDISTTLNTKISELTLPSLPYDYSDLQPYISKQVMELHHTKHHQTYLTKLKDGLSNSEESSKTLTQIFSKIESLEESKRKLVENHGGGYINHCFFWNYMSKNTGNLTDAASQSFTNSFGSFDDFKQKFSQSALSVFGSGWTWLIKSENGNLEIVNTANQISPLMSTSSKRGMPILGIDVWEHAYYLDYMQDRAKYIESWWNVVNLDLLSMHFKS